MSPAGQRPQTRALAKAEAQNLTLSHQNYWAFMSVRAALGHRQQVKLG